MGYKRTFAFFFLLFFTAITLAQTSHSYILKFETLFSNEHLNPETIFYKLGDKDSVRIDLVKYYISNIQFLLNDEVVWEERSSYHLVDATVEQSGTLKLNIPVGLKFNALKFGLGIDSATNVGGALGGDLDPTKGMYWTWQNGYINCKIEGVSSLCPTRKNEFQFHLGGYQSPFNAYQSVTLKTSGSNQTDVVLDIKKVLEAIDLARQNKIMSPGAEAVSLSVIVASAFSCKTP